MEDGPAFGRAHAKVCGAVDTLILMAQLKRVLDSAARDVAAQRAPGPRHASTVYAVRRRFGDLNAVAVVQRGDDLSDEAIVMQQQEQPQAAAGSGMRIRSPRGRNLDLGLEPAQAAAPAPAAAGSMRSSSPGVSSGSSGKQPRSAGGGSGNPAPRTRARRRIGRRAASPLTPFAGRRMAGLASEARAALLADAEACDGGSAGQLLRDGP